MHAQDDWVVVLLGAAQAGHEDVARDRLHDILDQLAAVGLQRRPLARVLVDALIDDLAAAQTPLAVARLATHPQARRAVLHVVDQALTVARLADLVVDLRILVAQIPATGQAYAHPVRTIGVGAHVEAQQAAHVDAAAGVLDDVLRRALDVVPQGLGARVRRAPRVDDLLDLLVGHCLEHCATHDAVGTDATLIASGQLGHLAL